MFLFNVVFILPLLVNPMLCADVLTPPDPVVSEPATGGSSLLMLGFLVVAVVLVAFIVIRIIKNKQANEGEGPASPA